MCEGARTRMRVLSATLIFVGNGIVDDRQPAQCSSSRRALARERVHRHRDQSGAVGIGCGSADGARSDARRAGTPPADAVELLERVLTDFDRARKRLMEAGG